jgi:bifunctional non-homologous end joining protein LigD
MALPDRRDGARLDRATLVSLAAEKRHGSIGRRVADFDALHSRVNDDTAFAYAFDLLLLDGDDIRRSPLRERRERLGRLLRKAKPGIRLSEHIEADGATVFAHACKLGLEGIVSKRVDAPYRGGRARTWIKVKNQNAPAFLRVQEGAF